MIAYSKPLLAAFAGVLLASCGGGGGGSSAPMPAPAPPTGPTPPPAVSLSFTNQASAWGLNHGFGFSADLMGDPSEFAGGVASGDFDNDGDIDLFIVRGNTGPNLLYVNTGSTFVESAASAGLALPNGGAANYKLSGPTFADMDGDNDLDLFVGGIDGDPSLVFQNSGDGTFTDVTAASGLAAMTSVNTVSAAFGDYDRDGDLDLVMAHWGTPRDRTMPGDTETLWRNESSAAAGIRFASVSVESGLNTQIPLNLSSGVLGSDIDYSFAPSLTDVDADGFPDLLYVVDFNGSRSFKNNGDGTFTDNTDLTQITDSNGMGSAVGDYDNDGDMDWFVSSIDGNRLYQNDGSGNFANVTSDSGVNNGGWGWGSCFADFNADGHLDIYQTNGFVMPGGNPNEPYTADASRLWMSNQDGTFTDRANSFGLNETAQGRGIVCADFDGDRDVDILLLTTAPTRAAYLWINDLNVNNAVAIDLIGPGVNTDGIGTKITAVTGGLTQTRLVNIDSNFESHNPAQVIIGLGAAQTIDRLTLTWPDGQTTIRNNVAANQNLTFTAP